MSQVALLQFREELGNPRWALRDGPAREQLLTERMGRVLIPVLGTLPAQGPGSSTFICLLGKDAADSVLAQGSFHPSPPF